MHEALHNFWYIFAESREVKSKPISKTILDKKLVAFRDSDGKVCILDDFCVHRKAPLSEGKVTENNLVCPYHGLCYNNKGQVTNHNCNHSIKTYLTDEKDGYIYVCLSNNPVKDSYSYVYYKNKNWQHLRFLSHFESNFINCVENFINVPHTVHVHPYVFRNQNNNTIQASIKSEHGEISIEYLNEKSDFGIFNWFLNKNKQTMHIDKLLPPNITEVTYSFQTCNSGAQYIITSQSVPISSSQTIVYTDIYFNFGFWNLFARPFAYTAAKTVIDQDIDIISKQTQNLKCIKQNDSDFNQIFDDDCILEQIKTIIIEIKQGKELKDISQMKKLVEITV